MMLKTEQLAICLVIGSILNYVATDNEISLHHDEKSWLEATSTCHLHNGHLLSGSNITNTEEINLVQLMADNKVTQAWSGAYYTPWILYEGCIMVKTAPPLRQCTQIKNNEKKMCAVHCRHTRFFALYGPYCCCRDQVSGSFAAAKQCRYKCQGNPSESCGGDWVYRIYLTLTLYQNIGYHNKSKCLASRLNAHGTVDVSEKPCSENLPYSCGKHELLTHSNYDLTWKEMAIFCSSYTGKLNHTSPINDSWHWLPFTRYAVTEPPRLYSNDSDQEPNECVAFVHHSDVLETKAINCTTQLPSVCQPDVFTLEKRISDPNGHFNRRQNSTDEDCLWTIDISRNQTKDSPVVQLSVYGVVEVSDRCVNDYIEIYSGHGLNKTLVDRLCGSVEEAYNLTSPVTLHYVTDATVPSNHLYVAWKSETNIEDTATRTVTPYPEHVDIDRGDSSTYHPSESTLLIIGVCIISAGLIFCIISAACRRKKFITTPKTTEDKNITLQNGKAALQANEHQTVEKPPEVNEKDNFAIELEEFTKESKEPVSDQFREPEERSESVFDSHQTFSSSKAFSDIDISYPDKHQHNDRFTTNFSEMDHGVMATFQDKSTTSNVGRLGNCCTCGKIDKQEKKLEIEQRRVEILNTNKTTDTNVNNSVHQQNQIQILTKARDDKNKGNTDEEAYVGVVKFLSQPKPPIKCSDGNESVFLELKPCRNEKTDTIDDDNYISLLEEPNDEHDICSSNDRNDYRQSDSVEVHIGSCTKVLAPESVTNKDANLLEMVRRKSDGASDVFDCAECDTIKLRETLRREREFGDMLNGTLNQKRSRGIEIGRTYSSASTCPVRVDIPGELKYFPSDLSACSENSETHRKELAADNEQTLDSGCTHLDYNELYSDVENYSF